MDRSKLIILVVVLVIALGGGYFLLGGDDETEETNDKVYTIGILSGAPVFDSAIASMQAELADAGYVEGENVKYDMRSANGDNATMQEISEAFVADKVDVIVTTTNAGALAARQATEGTDIPVVFMFVIAPIENGVVSDLQNIENVTGVRNPLEDFVGRRIEVLKAINPDATRIWAPYDSAYNTVAVVTAKLDEVAPTLGVEIIKTEITSSEDVIAEVEALDSAEEIDLDAIFIFPDLTVQAPEAWQAILEFSLKHQIPIMANTGSQVEEGALFSYLSKNEETGQQAARIVSLLLSGTSIKDLPVETAELFLIVNLETSENMGLTVSDAVLNQADTIIYGDEAE